MDQIKIYVRNNKICISIDETTDIDEMYVGSITIGALEVN